MDPASQADDRPVGVAALPSTVQLRIMSFLQSPGPSSTAVAPPAVPPSRASILVYATLQYGAHDLSFAVRRRSARRWRQVLIRKSDQLVRSMRVLR